MTPASLSLRAFGQRVLVAFLICVLVTIVMGVAVGRAEDAKVKKIRTVAIDPSLLRAGNNYLIVGSDTRSFVKSAADAEHFGSAQSQSGQRSDTMMVVHVDPGKRTGVLVSFPRDLWVPIPDHGTQKINAAFAFGGPQLAIKTIEQAFDIPISHYLEVDFAGFRDLVDAIGSVPIFFPAPARDKYSGLNIPTPGCHDLNGGDALAYVRSRYYEYEENGEWKSDPTSDIGRIQRQQYFIRSVASAAIHSVLSSPWRANKVADKSVGALSRDQKLTTGDLTKLVYAFRNPDPTAFPMFTLPATNASRDNQSVLILDAAPAAVMLARLRGEEPKLGPIPKIPTSSVKVHIENGSGVSGAAGNAQSALVGAGFQAVGEASDADRSDYVQTEVRYAPGVEEKARLTIAYLGGAGRMVVLDSAQAGADVVVVLGQDFQQVVVPTSSTKPAATTTPKGGAPTTTGPPANPGGSVPVVGC